MKDVNWKDLPNPTQAEIEEAGIGHYGDGSRTAEYISLLRQKKVRQSHDIKDKAFTIEELQSRIVAMENSMGVYEGALRWIANTKIHTWTDNDEGIRQIQNEAHSTLSTIMSNPSTEDGNTTLDDKLKARGHVHR